MIYSTLPELAKLKTHHIRLLGVDYGERHIGLAISDLSWTITRALPVLDVKKTNVFSYFKDLVEKESIGGIVIGYPKHMCGDAGELCQKVHRFCQKLSHHVKDIPIIRFDERLTSMMAERFMLQADVSREKRKQKLDSIAACCILQNALDFLKKQALFQE